jgi:hypothetical protein
MALKLRRGTEANRTSITPAEGEIIYVTDTKKLYVGDGSTPGGVLQGGSGGGSLTGITDNATVSVLTLGDATISIDADLSITGQEIVGDGDINISGDITASGAGTGIITANSFVGNVTGNVIGDVAGNLIGNVTGNASGAHTGTFDGDMTGSVFGNDSTVMVDGNNNTLHGNLKDINSISYATPLDISNETTGVVSTTYLSNTGEAAYLKIRRTDAGTAPDQNVGLLAWDQVDDTGTKTYVSFAGWHSGLYIGTASDGTTYNATNYVGITDGNMAIGDYTPAAGLRLDVRGNVKATGFIQTGSFTTAERDALTGANGMMIYNTTNSRFQIYEAGNWLNMREVSSGGGGSTDNYSHWNITADDSTLRVVNGQETIGILGGAGITTASDAEGNITITGTVIDFTDLGVTPTTLAGYGITDAIQAGSAFDVTGSVFGDDSTMLIDGVAGKIVGPIESTNPVLSGTIDSSDSSAITVVPAVVFSSDVNVENNLIVTNKIIADTIEVENIITNASGTPEISSDTDIILAAGTRVEVSSSPFKLASFTTVERDALSAENGDMIYNTTDNKFQGYENGAWANLI